MLQQRHGVTGRVSVTHKWVSFSCTCLTCANYLNRLHAWKPADCELKIIKKKKRKHPWMFNSFQGILWWTICCCSSFPSTCLESYIPQDAFWITPEKVPERVLWLWTKSKSCSVAAPVHSGLLRQLLVEKNWYFSIDTMYFSLYYRSVLNFSAYLFWKYLNMTSQLSTGS